MPKPLNRFSPQDDEPNIFIFIINTGCGRDNRIFLRLSGQKVSLIVYKSIQI